MTENNRKLRIHAQITPAEPIISEKKHIRWRCLPKKPAKVKLTAGDRLLRNSALACAMLLGILTLGNIDHPLARSASESVRQALTMHIDLDESIGRLSFVREFMPESALVFLDLSGGYELAKPAEADIIHPYTDAQPWILLGCEENTVVRAAADGTVTAVSTLTGGKIGLIIDHGSGSESVYAYLSGANVEPGHSVSRGQQIGTASATLYYELRSMGEPVDPTNRMGL